MGAHTGLGLPYVVAVAWLWSSALAFPLTFLEMDQGLFQKLKAAGNPERDSLATSTLLPQMQKVFAQAAYAIGVERGDVVVKASFPDTQVDDSCHHKIKAENPKAIGTLLGSSYLRFGVANVSWRGMSVFADAQVDAKLGISTDVCVRVGKKTLRHHCTQIARKTVGIDILSDGRNGIGINMTAYNAHIARVHGTWSLIFNFHASVVGRVLSWNVAKVHADNCKMKILGLEIASVCGTIERRVKKNVQKLTDRVTEVTAPNLLKKLEAKINMAIGSQVTIPLKIGAELVV